MSGKARLYGSLLRGVEDVGFAHTLQLLAEIAEDAGDSEIDDDKQDILFDISQKIAKLVPRIRSLEETEI